jgi:hypothetical protein
MMAACQGCLGFEMTEKAVRPPEEERKHRTRTLLLDVVRQFQWVSSRSKDELREDESLPGSTHQARSPGLDEA